MFFTYLSCLIPKLKRWAMLLFYCLNSILFPFFSPYLVWKQMSHSERALLLQPLWLSSFISCFIHWYWKWIETKRLHLHNECVKRCVCVFNPIAPLCETATCQMADMLNELKFGISGPHNLLIDEVISISLSTLSARVIQLSHSLCTQGRCSHGISW